MKALLATIVVILTLALGTVAASAGEVTSERVMLGQPIGTVRLDRHDYSIVMGSFVPKKSFDQMCEDARNRFGRYEYTTAIGGPVLMWNGEYYLTCTN